MRGGAALFRPGPSDRFLAIDPTARLLYRLLRDHLPAGTVAQLVKRAAAEGDVEVVPELGELASRYSRELTSVDRSRQRRQVVERAGRVASIPAKAQSVGQDILDRALAWVNQQGDRAIRPGELDEGVGISKVTRSRVITQLADEGKIRVEGQRAGRRVYAIPTGFGEQYVGDGASTSEPDHDDEEEGLTPADPSGEAGGEDHDDESGAEHEQPDDREHRGSGEGDRQSGSAATATADGGSGAEAETPGVAAPDRVTVDGEESSAGGRGQAQGASSPLTAGPADATLGGASSLAERVAAFIDQADGEVFRSELVAHFPELENSAERIVLMEKIRDEGRIAIVAPSSTRTRYRSTRRQRPGTGIKPRRESETEAAEPLGDSGVNNFRDSSAQRQAEATADNEKTIIEAGKAMPAVREWVRAATGPFSPRQLRDVFSLSPAACARVIATLNSEGRIKRVGEDRAEAYERVSGTTESSSNGRRSLNGNHGSLESRALAACSGEGATLPGVCQKLGISAQTGQALLSRLYRDGDVRTNSAKGQVVYVAAM